MPTITDIVDYIFSLRQQILELQALNNQLKERLKDINKDSKK